MTAARRVGLIGLGAMGAGMGHCLFAKGHALTVFARQAAAAQAFVHAGAGAAPSAAALGRQCDLVFLSLPDAAAVEAVLFGADGLVQGMGQGLQPGSTVVDTSTIAATQARSIGERLAQQGVAFLDAPVSGGQAGAQAGTLSCMIGGPAAAVDAVRDVMGAFCKTITHVGALGAGQTVKACNQVATAGAMLGVADALALARAQGVDPAVVRDVLLGGAARSFALEKHAPRITAGEFKPGFRARLMRKDLRLALDTARATQAVLPGAQIMEELLDALCEGGRADWDWCAVALEVQRRGGMSIPHESAQP